MNTSDSVDFVMRKVDEIVKEESVRIIQTSPLITFNEAAEMVREKVQVFLDRIFCGSIFVDIVYDEKVGFHVIFHEAQKFAGDLN
jgi:hypothetical protein